MGYHGVRPKKVFGDAGKPVVVTGDGTALKRLSREKEEINWNDAITKKVELLVSSGHNFDSVMRYSLLQLEIFARYVIKRKKAESLLQFKVMRYASHGEEKHCKELIKELSDE